jgi:hypothetical protein
MTCRVTVGGLKQQCACGCADFIRSSGSREYLGVGGEDNTPIPTTSLRIDSVCWFGSLSQSHYALTF